jgi:hypothetical protein
MCIDITKNQDGTYTSYDNGIDLDTPSCECSFQLPKADALNVYDFIYAHRSENLKLEIEAGSGFYPFMPHNGNRGAFLVAVTVRDFKGFLEDPYKYHQLDLSFTKVYNDGSWFEDDPIIDVPDVLLEGDITIAGVQGIPYPINGFVPAVVLHRSISFSERTDAFYYTRGANADSVETDIALRLNVSRTYALFNALINTVRSNTFALAVKSNQFPFGENYGDDKTFTVKLLQQTFELNFTEWNIIESQIKILRLS